MVWYTLEQHIFLYDSYVKYGSARKCGWKFCCKFHNEIIPSRQTVHSLVNKLRTMGLLIDKKQKHKCPVLTEKLYDIGARLEHTPRKSLKRLAQGKSLVLEWQHNCWSHPVKSSVWCAVSARRNVHVFFNETVNCKKYLCVRGWHFQHLLWSVNCNYFISNVIDHQACWFIGKICMRLAASDAPVTWSAES
jgi:hypothetical protein